jgi:hypothetical protein
MLTEGIIGIVVVAGAVVVPSAVVVTSAILVIANELRAYALIGIDFG